MLVKGQSRIGVRKYSFSQRTVNEWSKVSPDCVHFSSINMFPNRIDKIISQGQDTLTCTQWTLDKPTVSLSAAI